MSIIDGIKPSFGFSCMRNVASLTSREGRAKAVSAPNRAKYLSRMRGVIYEPELSNDRSMRNANWSSC